MRNAYRGLAYAVAALVALQAAFIAFALFGLFSWVEGGGTLDASTTSIGGETGLMLHGIVGTIGVPLVALVLLVISFFAKIPGGVKWAAIVFGVVVLQYLLALIGHGVPFIGALHGLNALILFGVAVTAAMRVRTTATRAASDATSVPVA